MNQEEINQHIKKSINMIAKGEQLIKVGKAQIKFIQENICEHNNKRSWTNNDGDGQFIVEQCLDCGLQKDVRI